MNKKLYLLVLLPVLLSLACSFSGNVGGIDFSHNVTPMAPQPTAVVPSNVNGNEAGNQTQLNGGNIAETSAITLTGFPTAAYPVRWGGTIQPEQTCPEPGVNWIFCDPGVISFDYPNGHDEKNPSAVWSGGAQVDNLMENQVADYSCPESGYVKVTLPNADMAWKNPVTGESMLLSLKAQPDTSYTVVFQCAYDGEGDRSVKIHFTTDENGAGNVKVMRYPVEAEHSGFFGLSHTLEDLAHARGGTDNGGNDGCAHNVLIAIGMNEGSYGIWNYNGTGLDLLQTNVIQPK